MMKAWFVAGALALGGCGVSFEGDDGAPLELERTKSALQNNEALSNVLGAHATFSTTGTLSTSGPFFQELGTNGRRCDVCHQPDQGFTITPSRIALRFARSLGNDPLFRVVDGAVSPLANVSTFAAKRQAYELLLTRGLIRVGIGIPEGAEFDLVDVDDPAGYASAQELSLFRRPLPATNLRFNAVVMWDGRESRHGQSFDASLRSQAVNATRGHAETSVAPSAAQQRQIVDFEIALHTAQVRDNVAGSLYDPTQGILGGPMPLASQPFYVGINSAVGDSRTAAAHDARVFTLFDGWPTTPTDGSEAAERRAAIARGQRIFNEKPVSIRNTPGINDDPALGSPTELIGTCGTCHNAPNVGSGSEGLFLNVRVATPGRAVNAMPLYTLRNRQTGQEVQTTDPGRALITGKWADIQRFKVPGLRGLAARAPYFHDGRALTLEDLVDFYDGYLRLSLTAQEQADLVAFLSAL